MVGQKIWVKRPGASATLVQIQKDDLVDDVRDMILKKYANSLGRNFDSPDVTLKISARESKQERTLGPDESITQVLNAYYPTGQKIDEALVIDVPQKRTPRPSPLPHKFHNESQPAEAGSDYFPPMPIPSSPRPSITAMAPITSQSQLSNAPTHAPTHAMSVITTGYVPAIPSPGSITTRRFLRERPRVNRQQTSSPTTNIGTLQAGSNNNNNTIIPHTTAHTQTRSRGHSNASEKMPAAPPPAPPPLPTPPASQVVIDTAQGQVVATPPTTMVLRPNRPKKNRKPVSEHPNLWLNGGVPPINVLIVEDNFINLKLLEAFMKRLKVRWQTAINGKIAVDKWKTGGFHLVLMDIQLPVMSGLDATREIRRLERLNSIGVFNSSASSTAPQDIVDEAEGHDKLPSDALFKSPVIIVALTASSLQSDRHEALAAGCNDFLTKPVNFLWLERKVMEWGCMQALIDFDGWRKWKDFSQLSDEMEKNKTKKSSSVNLNGMLAMGVQQVNIDESSLAI
ncbi:two-component response regulator SSK1p [Blumeria hordei DH14]|uniref:Two-component response regulator SSK1p n=1 Tax=Blumeria graminis f. sp. hordei (strain DH14) TaxID=546991 RepID=N1JCZ6_BLUG1|nr:two-component response regulator SSK1p [Blumeria hordei DH14]